MEEYQRFVVWIAKSRSATLCGVATFATVAMVVAEQ
jgi:hypothetical protein